jgi:hypothetical protein
MPERKIKKEKVENQGLVEGKAEKELRNEIPEPALASIDEPNFMKVSASSDLRTSSRRNSATSITTSDRFVNLEKGVVPFLYNSGRGNYDSNISAKDAIILCQKAYWNVPIFRNTIDLMTEFSISNVFLTGGNEQSRKFFNLWLEKINFWDIQDQFYREFYRSGNIFIYKFNADFSRENMMKIQEAFGEEKISRIKAFEDNGSIPVKYVILNPADINIITSSSFLDSVYVKILNDYEVQSLISPKTEKDLEIAQRIPEIKKIIDSKNIKKNKSIPLGLNNISLELEPSRLIAVFYKKQNYEPLSVPMGFAVLEDISSKLELKKIDKAIARSVQQAVLLITMGNEKIGMPSEKNINAMRKLFENQSVGKVLVADYSTEAKFVIPDIGNLLDPKKYEILDNDIRMGLNSILFGEEKFSNTSIKVKVFFARLKYGREKFLRDFLIPEMKKIGDKLGFKQIPYPKLEDIDFEDNVLMSRVYSRLIELGVLTPEEGLNVFETGRLPTSEESIESQKRYKKLRDEGYYMPLIGGPKVQEGEAAGTGGNKSPTSGVGRPSGTGVKQSTTRKSVSAEEFSCNKLKEVVSYITSLENKIEKQLKAKFNIKKLNNEQKEIVSDLSILIAQNENKENWENSVEKYVSQDYKLNQNLNEEIDKLAEKFGLDDRTATLLFHSKK